MLTISDLHKSYGDKEVLHGLDLEVANGEIFGFIGPNGSGKTTTIKSVVGILEFEKGSIAIDGHDIVRDPLAAKRLMAYLPDNPDLYENLTGSQYLNFIADIFAVAPDARLSRITELAKELEIYDSLGDQIAAFSHGMKQKLALVGALLHEPRLLVLDEPFVGLDPKAAYILKEKMRRLCAAGSSVFFSSHVLEVVEKLCDHVGILVGGKLVKCGRTEDIVRDSSLEKVFLELDK